jgi:hypothetical protein
VCVLRTCEVTAVSRLKVRASVDHRAVDQPTSFSSVAKLGPYSPTDSSRGHASISIWDAAIAVIVSPSPIAIKRDVACGDQVSDSARLGVEP